LGERSTPTGRSAGLLIRIVYALCLAGATYNHVRAVIEGGWMPPFVPPASALYWSSLTFLDPLAILLLFVRPRAGIALTVAIMATNVPHNLGYLWVHGDAGPYMREVIADKMVVSQIVFLLFVVVTAPIAWRASSRKA
jgi:hypothetical protein